MRLFSLANLHLQISGSVQLDSTAPQMLLAPDGPGLKHFRVPQHIHWPDALGHAAVCVYITPDALQASRAPALTCQQMRLQADRAKLARHRRLPCRGDLLLSA